MSPERYPDYPPEWDEDPIGDAAREIVDRIARESRIAPRWFEERRRLIQWVADEIERLSEVDS